MARSCAWILSSKARATVRKASGLGLLFLECGELDRALLPWLWRDVRPRVADNPEQIDFIVKLLVEIGLLTKVRGVTDRWLLPLRLLLKVLYPLYQL